MRDWIVERLPRALALAVLVLIALPAAAAHAEIIDFDPLNDEVPLVVTEDERAQLAAIGSGGFVYFGSQLSPSGDYVMAYRKGRVIVDTNTGSATQIVTDTPGSAILTPTWLDEDTMAEIALEVVDQGEDEPPLMRYHWIEVSALDGSADVRPFDAEALGGDIVDASPGYETFLVMELPEGAPPPILVDMTPPYSGGFRTGGDGLPQTAPGVIGRSPLGPMELQQAEATLALVSADGSNRRQLMTLPPESGIARVTWSEDGSRVSVTTRTMPGWRSARPRRDNPSWPGTPNLNNINVQEALGNVAPEDNPLVTGTMINAFDVASGASLAVFENADFKEGLLNTLAFSPSSSRALLVLTLRNEVAGRQHPTYAFPNGLEFFILDADLKVVKKLDGEELQHLGTLAAFSGDDELLFVVADEVDQKLVGYDLVSDEMRVVDDMPGGYVQMLTRGSKVVFTHWLTAEPLEMWTLDVAGNEPPSQVSNFNEEAAAAAAGLVTEDVTWTSSDGTQLHGYIVHSEDDPYPPKVPGPLVVWQAGGPGGQMTRDFGNSVESPYSLLPKFGIPVFVANAAGRNVKSPAFYTAMADERNFGQLDIAQIKEGVEHLIEERIVHPGRVGITGCSYGGYFTLQSMRTYPDFYASGNTQCSLTDLTEEFTFGYTPFIAYLMGAAPMSEADEYLRDSPLYGAKDVTSPLLIFHGAEDFLPVPLMNNLHDELEANGVDVTFLRVKYEGHGFGLETSQDYARQLQLDFFRRTLVEPDLPLPPRPGTIYLPSAMRAAMP